MKKDENKLGKSLLILNRAAMPFLKVGVVVAVTIDILFIDKSLKIVQIPIFLLIVVILRARKSKKHFSFKVFGLLLILTPIFLILGFENVAEKTAIWTYMFLILGSVQMLFSLRRQATNESKYS